MSTTSSKADDAAAPRIRRTGFLPVIGTERTTFAFLAGLALMLYLFTSIIGVEQPVSDDAVEATTAETNEDSEPEVDLIPNP